MDTNQEVISKLKFIGKLQKGEKINTTYMYVQPESYYTSITRTLSSYENRNITYNFVKQVISRTFEIVKAYERSQKDSDILMFKHINHDLYKATIGLGNLKLTYSDDVKFCCDIDTLLQDIHSKIKNHIEIDEIYNKDNETSSSEDEDEENSETNK